MRVKTKVDLSHRLEIDNYDGHAYISISTKKKRLNSNDLFSTKNAFIIRSVYNIYIIMSYIYIQQKL